MNRKFDVFISYARSDYKDKEGNVIPNNYMSLILKALEDAGISYWYDEEGIEYGDDFVEKILSILNRHLSFCIYPVKMPINLDSQAEKWLSQTSFGNISFQLS